MDHTFCPGAKQLRQPRPEILECPSCGAEVEIWSDEIKATCSNCKKTIFREGNMSCLDWCKYGKECVGNDIYERYMKNKAVSVKQQLLKTLEEYFGKDRKRIDHAKDVLHFAEELAKEEEADWHIVIPASILHDVGIKVAEEKYGSSAGHYQEQEGPPVARSILLKLGLNKEDIEEICAIIGCHHSPGRLDTLNFKVLYDADSLVNIRDVLDRKSGNRLRELIEETFLTRTAKELAEKLYLKEFTVKNREKAV